MDVSDVAELTTYTDDDVDARLRRNLKVLTATGVLIPKDIYARLGLNKTTWSQRFSGSKPTRFSLYQVLVIAAALGLTVEELVLPTEELAALVSARQNWKKLIRSDLQVFNGGGKSNGMRPLLFPVT